MTDPRNPLIAGVTNDASNALDSLLPTSYALNQILSGKVLASNVDANTLTACGKYQFNATTTNIPAGMAGLSGFITVTHERPTPPSNGNFGQAQTISFTPTVIHQVITCNDPTKGMWFRTYASSAWSDWKTVYNDAALTSAVSTLQSNLSTETQNRINGDSTLQGNLNTETQNRINGDSTLQGNLNTETQNRITGDSNLQTAINNLVTIPVGTVLPFMSNSATIPTGFILCNGAAFSRTTYGNLFGSIGTLYGVGDGSATFNVPDLRGRFLRGYLSGTSAEIGTAQASQNLSHTHSYVDRYPNGGGGIKGGEDLQYDTAHNFTTGSEGGTEARPINFACQWIIRY